MSYISTEKAAKLLMVGPRTIMKWVREGRLRARETSASRYVISRDSVRELLTENESLLEEIVSGERPLVPCWKYNADGGSIREECVRCPVFQTKNKRCYEFGNFLKESGRGATCCPVDCEDCSYYRNQKTGSPYQFSTPHAESDHSPDKQSAN